MDVELHHVGHRLSFHFVTVSASSLSMGTGLAGTTTLPLFMLSRFWSCYRSPGCFYPEVRPFALKGKCFQPFSALQIFNAPLDGARHSSILPFRIHREKYYTGVASLRCSMTPSRKAKVLPNFSLARLCAGMVLRD